MSCLFFNTATWNDIKWPNVILYVKLESRIHLFQKLYEIKKDWAGMCKYQPSVDIANDNDDDRDENVDEDDQPTGACAVDSLL